jgi:hypothetical protein
MSRRYDGNGGKRTGVSGHRVDDPGVDDPGVDDPAVDDPGLARTCVIAPVVWTARGRRWVLREGAACPFAAPKTRARGTPDAGCVRSLMRKAKSARVRHHESTDTSGVPHAVRLPACFVLSPVAIDTLGFVTVGTERFGRCASGPLSPAAGWHAGAPSLDASDGRQDHTLWAGAQRRCRWGASPPRPASHSVVVMRFGQRLHRPRGQALRTSCLAVPNRLPSAPTLPRPPHPAPRLVTIASRPSLVRRDG